MIRGARPLNEGAGESAWERSKVQDRSSSSSRARGCRREVLDGAKLEKAKEKSTHLMPEAHDQCWPDDALESTEERRRAGGESGSIGRPAASKFSCEA